MKPTQKYVVVITGATATGKSDLAIKLAQKIDGEIINADIGSWYTPLTIGTAKPDWKNEPVPHHLFDILSEPEQFNVIRFRQQVVEVAGQIHSRGKTPIIVGGSVFYIKALWYSMQDFVIDEATKADFEQSVQCSTTQDLWDQLHSLDPQRASEIYPQDRYRIIRALMIHSVTGDTPSKYKPEFDPILPNMVGIVCTRDRKELYDRIDARVKQMMHSGWIEEVQRLQATKWQQFLMHKKIIGYDDILSYLQTEQSEQQLQHVTELIQKKTRNYAKRQITFLGRLQKDISHSLQQRHCIEFFDEMNLTLCDVGLYINGLSNRLFKIFG